MKNRRRISQCPNCQTQLGRGENYCPNCGQENHFHSNSLRELWNDFIGSFLNFDGKVWTTLKVLFTKPGKVPKDFVHGTKKRYVPPMRLYLFVSFLFFLLFSLLQSTDYEYINTNKYNEFTINKSLYDTLNNERDLDKKINLILKDSIFSHSPSTFTLKINGKLVRNENMYRKLERVKPYVTNILTEKFSFKDDSVNYKLYIQVPEDKDSIGLANGKKISIETAKAIYIGNKRLKEVIPNKDVSFLDRNTTYITNKLIISSLFSGNFLTVKDTMNTIIEYYSYTLICMLPFTGILLFLFFFKRKSTYYNSVIYSIYMHAHMLIVGLVLTIISFLELLWDNDITFTLVNTILPIAFIAYIFVYNILGVKRFYEISYVRSVLTCIVFYAAYLLISIILLAVIVITTFL